VIDSQRAFSAAADNPIQASGWDTEATIDGRGLALLNSDRFSALLPAGEAQSAREAAACWPSPVIAIAEILMTERDTNDTLHHRHLEDVFSEHQAAAVLETAGMVAI
jgi:hypothetical protein